MLHLLKSQSLVLHLIESYKQYFRGSEESLYGDLFIADDNKVQTHMKEIYDKMGSQVCSILSYSSFSIIYKCIIY